MVKLIKIDDQSIDSCGLCPNQELNHNRELYCSLTGSMWKPKDELINIDCPFLTLNVCIRCSMTGKKMKKDFPLCVDCAEDLKW